MNARHFLEVDDVMKILAVGKTKAYEAIKEMNIELEAEGYRTVRGKVPRLYLFERYGIEEQTA